MPIRILAKHNRETLTALARAGSLSLTPFLHSELFAQFNRDLLNGVEYTVTKKPSFRKTFNRLVMVACIIMLYHGQNELWLVEAVVPNSATIIYNVGLLIRVLPVCWFGHEQDYPGYVAAQKA